MTKKIYSWKLTGALSKAGLARGTVILKTSLDLRGPDFKLFFPILFFLQPVLRLQAQVFPEDFYGGAKDRF
jgi:hypothetical protein